MVHAVHVFLLIISLVIQIGIVGGGNFWSAPPVQSLSHSNSLLTLPAPHNGTPHAPAYNAGVATCSTELVPQLILKNHTHVNESNGSQSRVHTAPSRSWADFFRSWRRQDAAAGRHDDDFDETSMPTVVARNSSNDSKVVVAEVGDGQQWTWGSFMQRVANFSSMLTTDALAESKGNVWRYWSDMQWGEKSSTQGKDSPRIIVTFINGIYHSESDVYKIAEKMRDSYFHGEVRYFYNPSSGSWVKDVSKAGFELALRPNDLALAKKLSEFLRNALKDAGPFGRVLHIAHSGGAILTYLAAKFHLSNTEKRRIDLATMGGGRSITHKYFKARVNNYYARNDPCLIVERRASRLLKQTRNLFYDEVRDEKHNTSFIYLHPIASDPVRDHSMNGPTYQLALSMEAQAYRARLHEMRVRFARETDHVRRLRKYAANITGMHHFWSFRQFGNYYSSMRWGRKLAANTTNSHGFFSKKYAPGNKIVVREDNILPFAELKQLEFSVTPLAVESSLRDNTSSRNTSVHETSYFRTLRKYAARVTGWHNFWSNSAVNDTEIVVKQDQEGTNYTNHLDCLDTNSANLSAAFSSANCSTPSSSNYGQPRCENDSSVDVDKKSRTPTDFEAAAHNFSLQNDTMPTTFVASSCNNSFEGDTMLNCSQLRDNATPQLLLLLSGAYEASDDGYCDEPNCIDTDLSRESSLEISRALHRGPPMQLNVSGGYVRKIRKFAANITGLHNFWMKRELTS